MKHLKEFQTIAQYNAFTADTANFFKPNVSLIDETQGVEYNPLVYPHVATAVFNVTDTESPTRITNGVTANLGKIEIDGVIQPSVTTGYTFNTTGDHTVKYYSIDTTIGNGTFHICYNLTSCTITNNVTSIGENAFQGCSGLTSIVIPDSVTSIGRNAFYNCSGMTSVSIGSGVTLIDYSAFYQCTSLTSIDIPSGVTTIGDYAFSSCYKLTSITIEAATPPTLGTSAFNNTNNCPIYVPTCDLVDTYKAYGNWTYFSHRITCHDSKVVARFNITDTTNPTKIVAQTASDNNYFSAVEIDGVELQTITTGYTFDTTGEHVIKYTLTDPTTIGNNAFYQVPLASISIPSGVTTIGDYAFVGITTVKAILMPSGVTSIGTYAFQNCNSGLTGIAIPTTVTSIGQGAFSYCSGLTRMSIPDGVTTIPDSLFKNCSGMTSCTIGDNVTSISHYAFQNCLTLRYLNSNTYGEFIIPSGVTTIGTSTFSGCYGISRLYLPSSLTRLDFYTFYYCTGVTSITCLATTAPYVDPTTFNGIKTNGTLYVPQGSTGYDTWMQTSNYYLGKYNWSKVEL